MKWLVSPSKLYENRAATCIRRTLKTLLCSENMRRADLTAFLTVLLCLNLGVQNRIIHPSNTSRVKYYNPSTVRLPGEWILVGCHLTVWASKADLEFKPSGAINDTYLPVNLAKIKRLAANIFNITHLTYNDSGRYRCTTFHKGVTWELPGTYEVRVLKEGKTC